MGGPPPWVSGGVAPDQRTARALEGRRGRVGPPELQGGDEGRRRRRGLGIQGQITVGITQNGLVFPLNGADGVTEGWPTYLALLLRVCAIIIDCCAGVISLRRTWLSNAISDMFVVVTTRNRI